MLTMNSHFGFVWSAVFLLAVFGASGEAEVVHLTDANFEQTIAERDLSLVNFYVRKACDDCAAFATQYSKAAVILKGSKPNTMLANIDCSAGGVTICKAYRISTHPTVIGFRRGEIAFVYNGERTSSEIVEYIQSQPDPFITELKSVLELNEYMSELDPSVIGFFEELNTEEALLFEKAAALLSDTYRFALCQSEEVLKEYGYKNDIVIFQSDWLVNEFEPSQHKYTDQLFASTLVPWIKSNIFGLVGLRTKNNLEEFENPLIVAYFRIDFVKQSQATQFWRNRILKVAKNLSAEVPHLTFAMSNVLDFEDELDEYKLSFDAEKPVIAGRDVYNQKFVLRESFTIERLQKFSESLVYGRLKPYLKSQEVPWENYQQVKVVVADTFDSIVNDPREEVFLALYDPQSSKSKQLAPVLEDLAEQLKEEYSIVIAKMDAVGNELPYKYKIEEYPTFYFVRKGHKADPLLYEGGHTVSDFIKFIVRHAIYPLATFDMDGRKLTKSEL